MDANATERGIRKSEFTQVCLRGGGNACATWLVTVTDPLPEATDRLGRSVITMTVDSAHIELGSRLIGVSVLNVVQSQPGHTLKWVSGGKTVTV